ncbi:MAG: oxidoreductase [Halieaceae bacterium]|jgi:glucose/arabinose dehydrogenase|nr:oxidoreductase [Halieaceae bacterium]
MTNSKKWARNVTLAVVSLGLILFLALKIVVGAVNTPLFGKEFDRADLGRRITAPAGFSVGLFADNVENARLLRFTHYGDLLVANSNLDQIVLLERDANGDGKADGKRILMADLNGPNGMDFFDGWLYVAETDAIGRIKFNHETGETLGDYERIVMGLPDGGNHWRKTLRFGPDGMMYVTMGSSCNVCEEKDRRRGSMVRYKSDGSQEEVFAAGLRNSAGFDWSPADGKIYATDNGRDLLGDNFPHCELNQVERGNHYGWPYANDDNIPDPDFGKGNASIIESSIAPAFKFMPHNAPLGITFVRARKLPREYHEAALTALHGSWNRSEKDGYKVVSLHWGEDGQITQKDFLAGFLQDDDVIGRPVDVAEGPDGAIYISDDYAHAVYRVAYGEVQKEINTTRSGPSYRASETLTGIATEQRQRMMEEGSAIYTQLQCAGCHAVAGEGMKLLEGLGEKYNVVELADYIKRPNPPMPTFPLGEAQRKSLAVYLIGTYPGQSL